MATMTESNGGRLQEVLTQHTSSESSLALQRAIQETERLRAENEEMRQLADVKIGSHGFDGANMAALWRIAGIFSKANILPKHFNGSRENCFIILGLAQRLRVDPFALMQKAYMVHGKIGLEAQAVIAIANRSGRLRGSIKFELTGQGDSRQCRAYATLDDGSVVEEVMSVQIAKSMGWWSKPDSMWPKMTDLMLRYRSASWLCRVYLPDIMLGIDFSDELRDRGLEESDGSTAVAAVDAVKRVAAKPKPTPAPEADAGAVRQESSSLAESKQEDQAAVSGAALLAEINDLLIEYLDGDRAGISAAVRAVYSCQLTQLDRKSSAELSAKLPALREYLESLPDADETKGG